MRPSMSDSVHGPLADNRQAVETLLLSAAAGDAGTVAGEDDVGTWAVSARLSERGTLIVEFEIADNTAVWEGELHEVDGNLTLWGEFEALGRLSDAIARLVQLEAEAHRLAYLVGAPDAE